MLGSGLYAKEAWWTTPGPCTMLHRTPVAMPGVVQGGWVPGYGGTGHVVDPWCRTVVWVRVSVLLCFNVF